jgi:alginate O-acetyltransferase complex protein AlgI
MFNMPQTELTFLGSWLGVLCFSLQIYYDFSSYSDMAIGLGRIFGFRFMENFNYPYIANSIRDFWRRWHISLTTWFRDYLYIPLGGNRRSVHRNYFNLFVIFVLCGLWHGASWNFLIWGLYHGLFLVLERAYLEKVLDNMPRALRHIYVLFIVCVGWVFFRIEAFGDAIGYLKVMFIPYISFKDVLHHINPELALYFVLGVLFSVPVHAILKEKAMLRKPLIAELTRMCITITIFVYSLLLLAASSYKPFIYFKF